jgi:hypothetical protein
MPYEIDDAEGRCLYRGDDLELACEIHDREPSAHLVLLPAAARGGSVQSGTPAGSRHPRGRAPGSGDLARAC